MTRTVHINAKGVRLPMEVPFVYRVSGSTAALIGFLTRHTDESPCLYDYNPGIPCVVDLNDPQQHDASITHYDHIIAAAAIYIPRI